MSKILVVIDMQNDFITGTLGSKEAQAIVPNVKAKIKDYFYQRYSWGKLSGNARRKEIASKALR